MADKELKTIRCSKTPVHLYRKNFVRRSRRAAKNLTRRLRRKRSITRYYTYLQERRHKKRTEDDLCSSVSVFGIDDMESESVQKLDPIEYAMEWKTYQQLKYWETRAKALEYENAMLHKHLRMVYESQIVTCMQQPSKQIQNDKSEAGNKSKKEVLYMADPKKVPEAPKDKEDVVEPVSNRKAAGEDRRKEMNKLYGPMAPKIMGMETAVQLNYDHHVEQSSVPYWPILPINLKYNS